MFHPHHELIQLLAVFMKTNQLMGTITETDFRKLFMGVLQALMNEPQYLPRMEALNPEFHRLFSFKELRTKMALAESQALLQFGLWLRKCFCGGSRSFGAMVGNIIAKCVVHLVSDRTDCGNWTIVNGANQLFIIK